MKICEGERSRQREGRVVICRQVGVTSNGEPKRMSSTSQRDDVTNTLSGRETKCRGGASDKDPPTFSHENPFDLAAQR